MNQARPEQLPKKDNNENGWLYLAGRGSGKTRAAAEEIAWQAIRNPKSRWAIVAPTFGDGRDICIEGESGILQILEEYGVIAKYNSSNGLIRLTNKSRIKIYSGDTPKRLRGPQHHGAWIDELAAFDYPQDAFDMLQFGLRLGDHPFTIVTTTPKPIAIIKDLIKRDDWFIDRGSTFDNQANLPASTIANLRAKYENTRLGRQELYAEILADAEGALWTRAMIDVAKQNITPVPPLLRVVIGVDPAMTANENSDSTGISVVGLDAKGQYWVLADLTVKDTPLAWANVIINAYHQYKADRIVVETNAGGDLVETVLRSVNPSIPITTNHTNRGKKTRAEPISALYEQGKVRHAGLGLNALEDQMCEWVPLDETMDSPDRVDALVWAISELVGGGSAMTALAYMSKMCVICSMPSPKSAKFCVSCNAPLGD